MGNRLFDPVDLMNSNLEANATKRTPLPVGEVNAQITKIEITDGVSGPASKKPGTPWARLDCTLEITDPEYLRGVGDGTREKAITFLGIMLDMQDGKIASGEDRNVRLGKLREACGVNGQPLGALNGQVLRIAISHKPNPNQPDETISEVTNYMKAV
jgi:hypothetical protein